MIAMLLLAQLTAKPLLELELGTPKVAVVIHSLDQNGFTYSLKSDPARRLTRDWASLPNERIVAITDAYFRSSKRYVRLPPLMLDTQLEGPKFVDLSLPPFLLYFPPEREQHLQLVILSASLRNLEKIQFSLARFE